MEEPVALPGHLLRGGVRERLRGRTVVVLALVASDALLAALVWSAAVALRYVWQGSLPVIDITLGGILVGTVIWVLLRAGWGLYPGYGLDQVEELRRQTYATLTAFAIHLCGAFVLQLGDSISRLVLVSGFAGLLLAGPFNRYLTKWALMKAGLWGKPVLVFGASGEGERLLRDLRREWGVGFRPLAVFDDDLVPEGGELEGVPYGGGLREALALARKRRVGTLVVAMEHDRQEQAAGVMQQASASFRHVVFFPQLGDFTNSSTEARYFAGTLGLEVRHNLLNPWARRAKRAVEIYIALAACTFILPLLGVLAFLVWLESGRPVFYNDRRMGLDGRLFSCLKLRTMAPDAERRLQEMLERDPALREEYMRYHKLRDDPRVTRMGRFLRKTSLDELPQIFHVLRGEMNLVGPRPYLPRESGEIGGRLGDILRVPPGVTGLWQTSGRNEHSFEERVQMDVYYVRNWSVWLDLIILARTVRCVLLGKGAY